MLSLSYTSIIILIISRKLVLANSTAA